jgi:hypothetical protein
VAGAVAVRAREGEAVIELKAEIDPKKPKDDK